MDVFDRDFTVYLRTALQKCHDRVIAVSPYLSKEAAEFLVENTRDSLP